MTKKHKRTFCIAIIPDPGKGFYLMARTQVIMIHYNFD